jgi:hypothetical protein
MQPNTLDNGQLPTKWTLVDSHCHLDFDDFSGDLDGIVARARAAGIGRMVSISTRVKRRAGLVAIADRFPDVYCSIGTHPHHAHEELNLTIADLVALTRHDKTVAIGEAGLDYHHYDLSPREAQERGFRNHIAAARETGLPLVIHSREADADMAAILEEETGKGAFPAVLHCFTGGRERRNVAVALLARELERDAPEPNLRLVVDPVHAAHFALAVEDIEVGLGPRTGGARDRGAAKGELHRVGLFYSGFWMPSFGEGFDHIDDRLSADHGARNCGC